jgi:hypothetical protein
VCDFFFARLTKSIHSSTILIFTTSSFLSCSQRHSVQADLTLCAIVHAHKDTVSKRTLLCVLLYMLTKSVYKRTLLCVLLYMLTKSHSVQADLTVCYCTCSQRHSVQADLTLCAIVHAHKVTQCTNGPYSVCYCTCSQSHSVQADLTLWAIVHAHKVTVYKRTLLCELLYMLTKSQCTSGPYSVSYCTCIPINSSTKCIHLQSFMVTLFVAKNKCI